MTFEESTKLMEKFYSFLTGRQPAAGTVFPGGKTGYFPYERFVYLRAICEAAMESKYNMDKNGNGIY